MDDYDFDDMKSSIIKTYTSLIKRYSPNLVKVGYFFRRMRLELLKLTMFERVLKYYKELGIMRPMQEYEFRQKVLSSRYIDYRIANPDTAEDEDEDEDEDKLDERCVYEKYSLQICISLKKKDTIAKTR